MSDQFDMGALLEQAQAVQQQLLAAQAAVADQEVEGQAGGGVVRVRVTGGLEIIGVSIDPEVVEAGDVQRLEDLVMAAGRDAIARAKEMAQEAMGGVDLGGLGGLHAGQ